MTRLITFTAICAAALFPSLAFAEMTLSFYGGPQEAPHSRVTGTDLGGVGDFDFTAGWEGRSFSAPPQYGIRATWWTSDTLGFGVELNHAKVYADDATLATSGFSHFEFSDGLNIITANVVRKWPDRFGAFTPYALAGVGVSVPHVEVTSAGGTTFEYQLAGPAVALAAGASYQLNDRWSLFGEYKFTYSINKTDLTNGGNLNTNVITNSLNLGVSFDF
jgi:lipid A oxidase